VVPSLLLALEIADTTLSDSLLELRLPKCSNRATESASFSKPKSFQTSECGKQIKQGRKPSHAFAEPVPSGHVAANMSFLHAVHRICIRAGVSVRRQWNGRSRSLPDRETKSWTQKRQRMAARCNEGDVINFSCLYSFYSYTIGGEKPGRNIWD